MKRGDKKGQLFGMPFSVIFSIVLIIIFIIAAWIGIKIFWNPSGCSTSDSIEEGLLITDLQSAVDDAWNSGGAENVKFPIKLQAKVKLVCFLDSKKPAIGKDKELYHELIRYGQGNMYLSPGKVVCAEFSHAQIKHINITETTKSNNPLCISNNKNITINFNENLVVLS